MTTNRRAYPYYFVIPAKAGIHLSICPNLSAIAPTDRWIPAFAGMTECVSP
jgi:hypothetical protein